MKRRMLTALPLIFAFVLTLLPFLLLQYNQFQRFIVSQERKLNRWEQRANNYLELFRSLWSVESQIQRRFFLFRKKFSLHKDVADVSASNFISGLRQYFSGKLFPETIYAGYTKKRGGKLNLLEGKEFTRSKRYVFTALLNGLMADEELPAREISSLNSIIRGAFGDNLDYDLLKNFRKGKATRVVFQQELNLLFWDSYELSSGRKMVYLCLFKSSDLDKVEFMKLTARLIDRHYPDVSAVFVPLELADAGVKVVFPEDSSFEQRTIVNSLLERSSGATLKRDQHLPFGEFFDSRGFRICREFIDYTVPYELWIMSREPLDFEQKESVVGIFLRLVYFSVWILVIVRVLITGQPIGISIKVWLNFIFFVVGIIPLIVFYMAGIYHIDASSYRREQEAVKEMLQQLEEADASGESLMAEYRDFCVNLGRDKSWISLIETMDVKAWDKAWEVLPEKFARAGLNIDSMFVYPPDNAGLKRQFYYDKNGSVNVERERTNFDFYDGWIRKSYFMFAREKMDGKEPDLPIFRNESGDEILRYFWSNRGDIEFINLGGEKHFLFQNYVLKDGSIHNWYFLRVDMMRTFERFLEKSISQLQEVFPDHIYSIATLDGTTPKLIFPRKGGGSTAALMNIAGKWIDLAAITRTHMIEQSDDYLVVTYPCVKSGPFILTGVVLFSGFRAQSYVQEKLLSLIVVFMTLPVFIISRFASGYLVKPLMNVEAGLKRIAEEDYSVKLQLTRKDELGKLSSAFDQMVEGLRERRNLGKFVSATLDEYVVRDDNAEKGGLEKRFGAILCSDIRGFTNLSEQYPVRDIVEMLNGHLAEISRCISDHGGLVEQFIGDEVLAVFHGKNESEASLKALRAARAIMERHRAINIERSQMEKFSYEIGVGIASGELLSGIVKAGHRSEYTVIGSLRSRAEQLEGRSKIAVHTMVVVTERIVELLPAVRFVPLADGNDFELAGFGEEL